MNMSNFIIEFERRHTKVKSHDCKYPDGVLAYKVLQAARLSQEHEKLCKATIATGQWSYKAVIEQIKKIFGDISPVKSEIITDRSIKLEPTLFANQYGDYSEGEGDDSCTDDDQNRRSSEGEGNDVYYGNNNTGRNNYYRNNSRNQDQRKTYIIDVTIVSFLRLTVNKYKDDDT